MAFVWQIVESASGVDADIDNVEGVVQMCIRMHRHSVLCSSNILGALLLLVCYISEPAQSILRVWIHGRYEIKPLYKKPCADCWPHKAF